MGKTDVPFLCFKLSVVDFWDKNIGRDGKNDNLLMALRLFEIFMKVMDVVNIVLDAIFVRKLYSLDQATDIFGAIFDAPISAPTMLAALSATSNTVAIVGPLLLCQINRYNPNHFDLTRVNMVRNLRTCYYLHWALMESSAFLLEDATTVYLYYFNRASLDVFDFADTANIAASFVSGIVSGFVVCYTIITSLTCGKEMKWWLAIAFFVVALTIYPVYLATFCLYGNTCEYGGEVDYYIPDPDSMEDWYSSALPQLAFFATYGIAGFFQLYLILATASFYFGCGIQWKTRMGLLNERNIPTAYPPESAP